MHCAKVLIVDDEPISRQTIAEGLRGKNFDVIEAESGQQAMERIQREEIDIVISVMVMPGMDGLELLKMVMRLKVDVPFLLVTGYPSQAAAANVMKAGASDFLAKPVTSEEPMHRVSRTLFLKSLDKSSCAGAGRYPGDRYFSGRVDDHHRGAISPPPLSPSDDTSMDPKYPNSEVPARSGTPL